MHIRIMIAALLVLGCATPEDGFVGRFSGSYECSGAYDDGLPYAEGPSAQTVAIERASDGSAYLAGSCTIPLDVIGPMRAEVEPTTCNAVLADGNAATVMFESGVIALDEPRLAYSLQAVMETGTRLVQMTCTFTGVRIE